MKPCCVVLAAVALGCSEAGRPPVLGSFTPDVPGIDTATEDIPVHQQPDAVPLRPVDAYCGGVAVSLTRRSANVILLIDRSGSMEQRTSDGMVKWTALREALQTVLPDFSDSIAVGLTFFPSDMGPFDGGVGSNASCEVPTTLAFEPRIRQSAAVLDRLSRTSPNGSTPTAASLRLAYNWYQRAADLVGDRYLILATDGAPNCDPAADVRTCRCTSLSTGPADAGMCVARTAVSCLDQAGVIAQLEALARVGVHTFVLGLNGVQDFADVLNAMADAGGRGRPGSPTRYYSAATASEITRQLQGISEVVADCTLRVMSPPPDPALVDVRLDGRSLYHDTRRANGWDWGDGSHQQIVFYGQACTDVRMATGGSRLVAAFGCPAPIPP
jgi:hypothetical protein